MVTSPWRERREVWREKRKVRFFGKGKCKLIAKCANFWQVKVCSSPILARQWWRHFRLSLSLSLSLYLSLSLSHRKYLTHNIGSASALPIIHEWHQPSGTEMAFRKPFCGRYVSILYDVNDTCPRRLANELQHAADCLSSWFTKWLLTVNPEETAMMIIRRKRTAPLSFQIFVNGKPVPQVLTHKHLGLIIEHTLSWTPQVISVCSRAAEKIGLLRRFRIAFPISQRNSCTRHRSGQSLSIPFQHGVASHKKTTSN